MKQIILDSITIEELTDSVANKVFEMVKQYIEKPNQEEEYLPPEEFAKILHISLVTLWRYDKLGITNPLRFGSLKRYRKSDIKKLLVDINQESGVKYTKKKSLIQVKANNVTTAKNITSL